MKSKSVNDGDTQNLSYENNIEGLNLSFAYKNSEFSNFDIPRGAVIHREDEHHDDGDDWRGRRALRRHGIFRKFRF